jgi:hypothetical protein
MDSTGFRAKAAEVLALVEVETDPTLKAQLQAIADSSLRMAEQAEAFAALQGGSHRS